MITYKCVHCGEAMTVPACLAGGTEKCPSCTKDTIVPPKPPVQEVDLDKLGQQLHHPETKVRCKAAEDLGGCKSLKAIEMLVGAFRDHDKFVRAQVTDSLRKLADPRGVGMLVRDLGGHWVSAAIVHEAVRELVKFGPIAGPPLIEILTETNKNPRKYEPEAIRASIMILGLLGEQKASSLIAKMFRRHFDIHVRDEAAYSLVMIEHPEQWQEITKLPESKRRSPAREEAKQIIKDKHILV
ncbi:MAG: HEAT repeat domain-containing protein [Phycisphaerales bacterium]|jgi:HEAT repeat protein|nr:HEAT repeat domain-containing protein [Phycisphaerales bacterium]